MKKYVISFIVLSLLTGCNCEGTFTTYTKVENLSTVDISLKVYKGGLNTNTFISNKGSVLQIGESHGRTKAVQWNFIRLIADSVIVEFGGRKKSIHYARSGNNPIAIAFANNRNVLNSINYVQKTIKEDKCYLEVDLIYTFTETDYVNVK